VALKVLIIGGGGREHALAWRLSKSSVISEVIASPGNPGIAAHALCVPTPQAVGQYAELAEQFGVGLTVVGPEAPLAVGVVDHFRSRGLKIVGPTQAAARLESSKVFAKEFFVRAGIPTARSIQTHSIEEARKALGSFSLPVVIKADGLAAGKGVVIAATSTDANTAIEQLGPDLVIEEFLDGEEVSFICISDGTNLVPFAPSQDHKRAFDGDQGPNTGGMGAYCDPRILTEEQTEAIMDRIMYPAIRSMQAEGAPFTGFLYAGLMMTQEGPKVLEFNVRMGDPETQAILYGLDADLGEALLASVHGETMPKLVCRVPAVCVVMAAHGYPGTPKTGDRIHGLEGSVPNGAMIFQAGTKLSPDGVVTAGGRVLGVTAAGNSLPQAIASAYEAVECINFDGAMYRKDIGHKGVHRW
jgi:phosphoribosylamine---glycine ligase